MNWKERLEKLHSIYDNLSNDEITEEFRNTAKELIDMIDENIKLVETNNYINPAVVITNSNNELVKTTKVGFPETTIDSSIGKNVSLTITNPTTDTIVLHECGKCHICGGSVYSNSPFSINSFEANTICHECKDAIKWVKNQMKSNRYAL